MARFNVTAAHRGIPQFYRIFAADPVEAAVKAEKSGPWDCRPVRARARR